MTDFAARVRRVRMKNGADVHVLHTPRDHINESGDAEHLPGKIIDHAKSIAGYDTDGSRLDGFVVIGLYDDGSSSVGFRTPKRIPECLIASYVSELLRRDTLVSREAERTFNRMFYWHDGAS